MPFIWTLIVVAGILFNLMKLRKELQKPKAGRNQAEVTKSALMIVVGIGLLIWSQTMLAMITAMISPFWAFFGAGIVLVLIGLAKQKLRSPVVKRMGKQNIVVGLILMAATYYYFYMM